MTYPWERYRPEFKVPRGILDLVDAALLRDWTNKDSSPHFVTVFPDGSELVLWVDHPQAENRWFDVFRYSLQLKEPQDPVVTMLSSNSLDEVLAAIRQVFEVKGGPRPLSG
jgi:hypothetical protein